MSGVSRAADTLLYAVVGASVLILITMAVSFPLGAFSFFDPALGGTPNTEQVTLLPLIVFGISTPIPLPGAVTTGEFFLTCWAVNLTLFVIVLSGPWSGFVNSLKNLRRDKGLAVYSNSGLTLGLTFPAVLLLAIAVEYILNASGLPVGGLSTSNPRYLFLLDAFAPLREEIGFRVTIVGVVCFLLVYNTSKSWSALRALWHPSKSFNEAGLQVWKQPALYAVIALSALAFGAAHVLGGGWEIGKFFSASLIGVILAVVYFTHGFAAAVMLHWAFDYYQSSFLYFDEVRGLTDSAGNLLPGAAMYSAQVWVSFLLLVGGVLTFTYFALIFLKTIRGQSAFRGADTTFAPAKSDGSGWTGSVSGASEEVQCDTAVSGVPDGRGWVRAHG